MVDSTIILNCSVTSDISIDEPLILWRAPNGTTVINSTANFTGGVSSSLELQLGPLSTSDAGQYTCEVSGWSPRHVIASSKNYSIIMKSE